MSSESDTSLVIEKEILYKALKDTLMNYNVFYPCDY